MRHPGLRVHIGYRVYSKSPPGGFWESGGGWEENSLERCLKRGGVGFVLV
jgi:hypothetical protein